MTPNLSSIPLWNDVVKAGALIFPHILDAKSKFMRVERVRYEGRIIPAVFLKYPVSSFRTALTDETSAKILMDLVTVFPLPTPLAYVIPVIFDNLEDPFWHMHVLYPVPPDTIQGVPVRQAFDYDPRSAGYIVLDFAQKDPACAIVVLDERNNIQIARICPVEQNDERLAEIRKVIPFLWKFEMKRDLSEIEAATKGLFEFAWFPIKGPDGEHRSIPPERFRKGQIDDIIISIMLQHGRLVDRRAKKDTLRRRFHFQLFVSHAHWDSGAAKSIVQWLRLVFPEIRIAMTDPKAHEHFTQDPQYFLRASRRSQCLLFVASKNSIRRRMVLNELSSNAAKPIIIAAVENFSIVDLDRILRTDPFLALDRNLACELAKKNGWLKLATMVGRELGLPLPNEMPPHPKLRFHPDDRNKYDALHSYIQDWVQIVSARKPSQTREQAEASLDEALDELQSKLGIDLQPQGLEPEGKLWMILDTVQEIYVPGVLDSVPAIVTNRILTLGEGMIGLYESEGLPEETDRFRRILKQIERWIRSNRK